MPTYPDMMGPDQKGPGEATPFWWRKEYRGDIYSHIWKNVDYLLKHQSYYANQHVHLLRMYSNRMASSLFAEDFSSAMDYGQIIRLNMVRACVDTAIAQIGAERSRTMHLSVGADSELQRKAKQNDQFVVGLLNKVKHSAVALDVFRDGAVWGSGWNKWYTEGNNIKCERVPATEMVFDDHECRYGKPQTLYQVKDYDPDILAERFPKKKKAIKGSAILRDGMYAEGGIAKPVTAIEAWHLPSGPNAKDGLHSIIVSEDKLLIESWDWRDFPFTKWDWMTAMFGLPGIGMVENAESIQVEINFIAQKIQRIYNLAGSVVWLEKNSGATKPDNRDFQVRRYTGRPPIIQSLGTVGGEFFNHMWRLYAQGFDEAGISQMFSEAGKPADLESGEALRVHRDIGTRRYKHTSYRWADFNSMDTTEQIHRCGREILARGGDIELVGEESGQAYKLSYKDIVLPKNGYLIRKHPVGLLPDEPAGKVAMLGKLAEMFGPEHTPHFMQLIADIPDLESVIDRMAAPYNAAITTIQRILETGDYRKPRPHMNLTLLRDLGTKELNLGYVKEISEDRLEALSRFLDEVDWLEEQRAPKPMPPVMAPGASMMPGSPQPTPQAEAMAAQLPPGPPLGQPPMM